MEYFSTKHTSENCSRCGTEFTCKPLDISQCDCMQVRISPEEQNYISETGSTCVCNKCLKELKQEYYLQYQKKNHN
ncbi:MAG: cysteine-rich CWC family protein [Bacteroidetes bacterium]|nr:cysteine-rich CWC family protein [Bacteroidota bacterium]